MKRIWARIFAVYLLLFVPAVFLAAAEFNEGSVRLIIHENTGRFSLLYLNEGGEYEPVIFAQDPRTSFLSVLVNDRAYKLGDSLMFRTRFAVNSGRPAFTFESSRMLVTEEFSFIKTNGSETINGIEIRITAENKTQSEINVGVRFLLDTFLGEKVPSPHFYVDKRPINSEAVFYMKDNENVWISKNSRISIMGSISLPDEKGPDSIYFANWKRLTDVSWQVPASGGRSFNAPPYSIGDSAVCYYFGPRACGPGDSFTAIVLLAAEDNLGFNTQFESSPVFVAAAAAAVPPITVSAPVITPAQPAPAQQSSAQQNTAQQSPAQQGGDRSARPASQPAYPADSQFDRDMALILDLINRIDNYIVNNNITEEELTAMEQTLDRLMLRYGLGSGITR